MDLSEVNNVHHTAVLTSLIHSIFPFSRVAMQPQTSKKDQDIQLYLKSRFGIEVTAGEVKSKVINGFGGYGYASDDCLDLMELVSMLLIPTILKASNPDMDFPEGIVQPREGLINYVLDMILHDVRENSLNHMRVPSFHSSR